MARTRFFLRHVAGRGLWVVLFLLLCGAHLGDGECGAVGTPAGATKEITQAHRQGVGFEGVLEDGDPFVESDQDRIEGGERLEDAVFARFIGVFSFKSAEYPIPEDQDAPIIFVEVFEVDGVVDAVVRRGVEDPFERSEPIDGFGVDPELIDKADTRLEGDQGGMKAEQGQGKPKQPSSREKACPCLAQGSGEVVVLGGVVVDVSGPQPP